ncbi:hypothetical protein BDV06DRAFT_226352 [Aspergillus oleicola]
MRDITVVGNHREIGLAVDQQAVTQVAGSIGFYSLFFKAFNDLEWSTVRAKVAERYCRGCKVDIVGVLAIDIRSEVAFGLFDERSRRPMAIDTVDGCTTLGWKTPSGATFLAQN